MIPYGVYGSQSRSEVCDDRKTPLRKGICTCGCKTRKQKLSNADRKAYKIMKGGTRQRLKASLKLFV